jgi:heterodisulfide reductase subunit B
MPVGSSYAYYPGCTLHSTAKEYDVSLRLVCQALGIELRELKDWACCGAASAHAESHLLGIALPARTLQAAEEMGLPVGVACAMCFSRLKLAGHELADRDTLSSVRRIIGRAFDNKTTAVHMLQVLDGEREALLIQRPLEGLNVASYYGCLLVRPRDIVGFDDEENPQMMDRLLEVAGARPVQWAFKTECCGAGFSVPRPDIHFKLSHRILSQAKASGADCISVACPLCHANLDNYQQAMRREYKDEVGLPILYFTQLLGLALGFKPRELLLGRHLTDPLPVLKAKGLA